MYLKEYFSFTKNWIVDSMLIIGILISSLISFEFHEEGFWNNLMGWRCERFGLIWGILFYRYSFVISQWLTQRRIIKILLFSFLCAFLSVMYLQFKSVFFGENIY